MLSGQFDNYLLIYCDMSIIPSGYFVHRPTGFHFLSHSVVSDLLTLYGVRGDDGVMDDDVGDVQFYSHRIYKVCLFVIYGFALG